MELYNTEDGCKEVARKLLCGALTALMDAPARIKLFNDDLGLRPHDWPGDSVQLAATKLVSLQGTCQWPCDGHMQRLCSLSRLEHLAISLHIPPWFEFRTENIAFRLTALGSLRLQDCDGCAALFPAASLLTRLTELHIAGCTFDEFPDAAAAAAAPAFGLQQLHPVSASTQPAADGRHPRA